MIPDKMVQDALRSFWSISSGNLSITASQFERMHAALETACVGELIEALKPFAEIANEIQPVLSDTEKNILLWAVPTIGDLRRARAVLEKLGGKL